MAGSREQLGCEDSTSANRGKEFDRANASDKIHWEGASKPQPMPETRMTRISRNSSENEFGGRH
jgi:hypothetical protein